MKRNRSVAKVSRIFESLRDDPQKRIRELKRCVREGHQAGDCVLMGSAFCFLTDAYYALEDLPGMLDSALKAVTLLKDTEEYEMIAKSYSALGHAYTYHGNNQLSLVSDEIAYAIVRKHRVKGQTRIAVLNNLSVILGILCAVLLAAVLLLIRRLRMQKKQGPHDQGPGVVPET